MKNKTRICILLAFVLLLLSACAGTAQGTDSTPAAEDEWNAPDEDYLAKLSQQDQEKENPQTEPKRVGVAMPTKTSERWINDGMNMKAKLETLGYEVDLQYADDDIELQVSQIESMIRNGVNCLVIASIDSTQLTEVLSQARDKGIAVIAYDRLLMDTDAVSYYATFDNKAVGTLIGRYIEDKMELKSASEKGQSYTIEFFMGSPDDNNAVFLYNGIMEVMKPYLKDGTLVCRSGLTEFEDTCILRWSEDTAEETCIRLLNEYYPGGDLDIACSAFDGFAYGILKAWQKKGFSMDKLPMITGQDAEKPAIKNIAEGKMDMTIYKDTRVLASKCVTMVQALLENGEPEINDTTQYHNNVLTVPSYLCEPVVIDRSNYEEILIGGGYYTKEQLFQ
ncbi:MAG: sugar-binding protein [Lachnospiraceae bacterium]|nr:sugar-binding protein [Lachnospiraceae bacterium]